MEPGARARGRGLVTQIAGLSRPERVRALQQQFPADDRARNHFLSLLDLYDALHVQSGDTAGRATTVESPQTRGSAPTDNADTAPPLLRTGASYGPYQVVRPLGSGGMGQVFLARDIRLGRHVALKSLAGQWLVAPTARRRLMREAEAAAALVHPNIATLYDVLELDDHLLLVMEYVEGRTVQALLEEAPIPLRTALHIAAQMAAAIAYAHDHHVVHCDVKPGNIQVSPDGAAKVLDFGLARVKCGSDEETDVPITSTGRMLCTPGYVAPERIVTGVLNASGDIYSMGVVLFEMVTGRRLFDPSQTVEQWFDLIEGLSATAPAVPPNMPAGLDKVIAHALAAEPAKRYQSAHDFARDVNAILDALKGKIPIAPLVAQRAGVREVSPQILALRAAAVAGGTIVLVALAGLVTSATFNLGIGRTADFDPEAPLTLAVWGVRSLLAPAVLAVMALIVGGIGVALGKAPLRLIASVTSRATRRRFPIDARLTGPVTVLRSLMTGAAAQIVLIAQAVALAILLSTFSPIVDGFSSFAIGGESSALRALSPQYADAHRLYRVFLSIQLVVFTFAWFRIVAARGRESGIIVVSGLALTLFSLFMLVAPYRTLLHNHAERAMFGAERCYLVAQRGNDGLLFCPSGRVRARIVSLSSPELKRDGTRESIFTEVR
jgi:hypothetical protein